MQRDIWSRKFDWVKANNVWYQQDRLEQFNDTRFINVSDVYFKFNKYLTGVTFSYINNLQDIYKKDILTGDGYSIVNMYNEYDVIRNTMMNFKFVDVATIDNIDLRQQWYKLDNVKLRVGHLVLLYGQTNKYENDVYRVSSQFYLINANLIPTRDKSYKFTVGVKLGTGFDRQFYLVNNGSQFPITNEVKVFIEGRSFIVKHLLKYNLYNTSINSGITTRVIFTDYDLARKQITENYSLYNNSTTSINNSTPVSNYYFKINYHHNDYSIRTGITNSNSYTGLTTSISNVGGYTVFPYISPFDAKTGDYLNIRMFTGLTDNFLNYNVFIKDTGSTTFRLEELLPNNLLIDVSATTFEVINYSIATNWNEAITNLQNNTPYNYFYSLSATTSGAIHNLEFYTREAKFDKYFDYHGLTFGVADGLITVAFTTANQFLKYKLYDRLAEINPPLFLPSFSMYNSISLVPIYSVYTDNHRVVLTFASTGLTSSFRKYTFVQVNGDSLEKTLIWNVTDTEITIEKPVKWLGTNPVTSIQNIDGLTNISDLLYELYMNIEYDWYKPFSQNIKSSICGAYAKVLTDKIETLILTGTSSSSTNITGIIYENDANEYTFKLYDTDGDSQLYYKPIELIFVGGDRKTRFPVNLKTIDKLLNSYFLNWNILDGGYNTSLSYYWEYFDLGLNTVIGVPDGSPFVYSIIDGNG